MSKIFYIVFSAAIIAMSSCSSIIKKEASKSEDIQVQEFPGYYDQWLYIKSNGSNVIPDMRAYNWMSNSNKRGTSNALLNVYELGPNNIAGRIRAMVVDWSNPNKIIIGGASGGIFISENKGASWKEIDDQAISPSVTYMDQSPFEANVIYYCTGEATGNSADLIGAGIFKSIDGGYTFAQLAATNNSNFDQSWSLKCSPKDSNTLYVATNNSGLWRSLDAGLSFTKVHTISAQINDLELLPDGSVLFTVKGGGVYRSPNGNLGTYSKLSSIVSSSSARGELAYCKNFPNVVYAAISGPDNSYNGVLKAFYKSSDGGLTFTQKTNPNGKVNFGFTWYAMTMGVKENDSNHIFIAGVDAGGSTNGGNSWVSAKEMHSDIHIAVGDGNNLYVGSDGGLSLYTWGDYNNYSSFNNGINITQFYAGDVSPHDNAVMGGTQDNGTKESLNKSNSFSSVFGADGGYPFYHATNQSIKYYSTQNGIVYRSGTRISDNLPTGENKWFIHPYHVSAGQGDIVVYPSNLNLYYSSNGGSDFKTLGKLKSGRFFCANSTNDANPAVFSGGSAAFVGVDSANNNGVEFEDLRTNMPLGIKASFLGCITIVPGYRDRVFLAYSNVSDSGRLYIGKDLFSNPSFVNISGNLPKGLPVNWVECDPFNPEMVIFAGTDYGLYVTEDGGVNWIKDTRLPNTVISSIKVKTNKKDIYFFTHGRGIFKGLINNNGFSSVHSIKQNSDISLYPIPAKNQLHLSVDFLNAASYKIINYTGKTILEGTIVEAETSISTETLPEGQYILIYSALGKTLSKKFSVMR